MTPESQEFTKKNELWVFYGSVVLVLLVLLQPLVFYPSVSTGLSARNPVKTTDVFPEA